MVKIKFNALRFANAVRNYLVRTSYNIQLCSVCDLPFSEPFKLCTPFNGSKQEDVSNFISSLVGIAMGAVQYDFNAKGHGLMDITEVCETMIEKKNGNSAVERLAKLNEL